MEAVLSYSRTRGSARVLLATLAAVADQHGTVAGLSAEEIQTAAGMADSTYRRARAALLASGELLLAAAGGGRARTNHWQIPNPSSINPEAVTAARPRPVPRPGTRPLLATTRPPESAAEDQLDLLVEAVAGERKGPGLSGVSGSKPRSEPDGFARKGSGIERGFHRKPRSEPDGLWRNPATNPARNPATQRAHGKGTPEPQNQKQPPQPP